MHRLIRGSAAVVVVLSVALGAAGMIGCGGDSKKPDTAADKDKPKTDSSELVGGGDDKLASDKDGGAGDSKDGPKKDVCTGFQISNLEEMLNKSDCEVEGANPSTLSNAETKDKLVVSVTASPTKVAPGGKVDLLVKFENKTKEPMALQFRIDPLARFETEVYDAKKKRIDMPTTPEPALPKGHTRPAPAEQKVAKVTIAANGQATVRVPWDAVKMKWAPADKARGTAVEKGFPRVPNGPLPKGKYTVKVVTPLVGVMEGGDHEVSAPKVEIEVG